MKMKQHKNKKKKKEWMMMTMKLLRVIGEVENGFVSPESKSSSIIRPCSLLWCVKCSQPNTPPILSRITYLCCEFTPRPLSNPSVPSLINISFSLHSQSNPLPLLLNLLLFKLNLNLYISLLHCLIQHMKNIPEPLLSDGNLNLNYRIYGFRN